VSWAALQAAAPDLAAEGRRLIHRSGTGDVLLATVRGDGPLRIHPINVAILEDHLYAFILVSPKCTDLERDGRYAMHAHQDPAAPSEFSIRGHAHVVTDRELGSAIAASWSFEPDDTYRLFEFGVDAAVLGTRRSADDWPPVYTSWRVAGSSSIA
jgi:hypothetical protein